MRIRVICSDFLLFVSTSLGYAFRDFRVVHLTHEQLGACTYCEYRHISGCMATAGSAYHGNLAHYLLGGNGQGLSLGIKTFLKHYMLVHE